MPGDLPMAGFMEFLTKLQPLSLNATRIAIGFTFWTHGGQKLFAWFGREEPVQLMSRFGAAGIIEFFGGLMIIFGVFTRPVAFIISGHMAVTYWWMHVARSGEFWHWANRGELPAVYAIIFLLLAAYGGGQFSVDGMMAKRKS
jgi:putative oxidoreductase